jgi:hypothetical protein
MLRWFLLRRVRAVEVADEVFAIPPSRKERARMGHPEISSGRKKSVRRVAGRYHRLRPVPQSLLIAALERRTIVILVIGLLSVLIGAGAAQTGLVLVFIVVTQLALVLDSG